MTESTNKTTLAITGMSCSGCSGRVQRALADTPGVIEAEVDLEAGSAEVQYETGSTSPEMLAAVVTKLGYGASLKSV